MLNAVPNTVTSDTYTTFRFLTKLILQNGSKLETSRERSSASKAITNEHSTVGGLSPQRDF